MLKSINILPRWVIFLIDLLTCYFAYIFSFFIKNNFSILAFDLHMQSGNLLIWLILISGNFFLFRTYAGIVRYTGPQDALRLGYAVLAATGILYFISLLSTYFGWPIYFSALILSINLFITTLLLIAYRLIVKYLFSYLQYHKLDRKHVIIYGAGEAGFATKRVLEHDLSSNTVIVAFVDDDIRKVDKVVDGIKIHHTGVLQHLCMDKQIDEIIIAAFTLPPTKKNELVDFALDKGIKVLSVPPIERWINGEFSARQLQTIKIENLLERAPILINNNEIINQIRQKRILVTGAAGSIGSEIVRQLLQFDPAMIILFDQAETPLHQLEMDLLDRPHSVTCIPFLGDITNRERLQALFELYHPQYVFHAAAYKHLPMMELFPTEAILTNVLGTRNIANLSLQYAVERFVMVSTDKAVNPTNVMGTSKRLAEIYIQNLHHKSQGALESAPLTKFITTRFGNVLGSNGSVINRFKEQIEKGGPVTVTHPEITRFFMTIPEACQLVLEAGAMGKGGEIFVFDMGKPVAVLEMARKMIRLYGLIPDVDIAIKFTGLRPGEKLFEELWRADNENLLPTYHEKIMIANAKFTGGADLDQQIDSLIALANNKQEALKIIEKMQEIVPEFISTNTFFTAKPSKN